MSKPDRTILDAINQAWDRRVTGKSAEADEETRAFIETIDELHRADSSSGLSPERRQQLRNRVLAHATVDQQDDDHVDDEPPTYPNRADLGHPPPTQGERRNRNGWSRHILELAAILLIVSVAIVAVMLFRDDDNSTQPGTASDDDTAEQNAQSDLPEPDDFGNYMGVSFDDAQALTPFPLRMPDHVPDGYTLEQIIVTDQSLNAEAMERDIPPRDDAEPWMSVVFIYDPDDGPDRPNIRLTQQNSQLQVMGRLDVDTITEENAPSELPATVGQETLDIDGIDVRWSHFRAEAGHDAVTYSWNQDATGMQLQSSVVNPPDDPQLREGEFRDALEHMIQSIIEQRETDELPPASPFETSEPAEEPIDPGHSRPDVAESFDEAQGRTEFNLVDPRGILDAYDLSFIHLSGPPEAPAESPTGSQSPGGSPIHSVQMILTSDDTPGRFFELWQSTTHMQVPSISESGVAIDGDGTQSDREDAPDPVQERIDIDGIDVIRTIQHNVPGHEVTTYLWSQDGLSLQAFGLTEVGDQDDQARPGIDAQQLVAMPADDLEAFVTALIEQRRSDEGPASATDRDPTSRNVVLADTTIDDARDALIFEPRLLTELPDELELQRVDVSQNIELTGAPTQIDLTEGNHLRVRYGTPGDADVVQMLELIQSTMPESTSREFETIEIDGNPVEYALDQPSERVRLVTYRWEHDGIHYTISLETIAMSDDQSLDDLTPPLTDPHLRERIGAMIGDEP